MSVNFYNITTFCFIQQNSLLARMFILLIRLIFDTTMSKFYFNKLRNYLELVFSITLILSCIYNYLNAPKNTCSLVKCNDSMTTVVKSMFPRSVALACMISKITTMYKNIKHFQIYKKKIKEYELYFPINIPKKKFHRLFTITIVFAYIVLIVPINILRIYLISYNVLDTSTWFFYLMMYVQNLSMCSTEIHFIIHCFGLYQKYQLINEDMETLKSETIIKNKYPVVLQAEECNRYIGTSSGVQPLAGSVEALKMRHQFVRHVVRDLNDLFGIQLGLSLCVLFIMALFDIYGEVFSENTKTRSKILIYGWLLQYSFRFCTIVLTTHATTKQVFIKQYILLFIKCKHH